MKIGLLSGIYAKECETLRQNKDEDFKMWYNENEYKTPNKEEVNESFSWLLRRHNRFSGLKGKF